MKVLRSAALVAIVIVLSGCALVSTAPTSPPFPDAASSSSSAPTAAAQDAVVQFGQCPLGTLQEYLQSSIGEYGSVETLDESGVFGPGSLPDLTAGYKPSCVFKIISNIGNPTGIEVLFVGGDQDLAQVFETRLEEAGWSSDGGVWRGPDYDLVVAHDYGGVDPAMGGYVGLVDDEFVLLRITVAP